MTELDLQSRNGNMTDGSTQNVDQIREILFGSQMRLFEKRVDAMEEQNKEFTLQLRNDFSDKFNNVKDKLNSEVTNLKSDLIKETSERRTLLDGLSKNTSDSVHKIEGRLNKFEQSLESLEENFHAQLLEQSKFIYSEIQEQLSKLSSRIEKTMNDFDSDKIGKNAMHTILTKVADFIVDDENENNNNKKQIKKIKYLNSDEDSKLDEKVIEKFNNLNSNTKNINNSDGKEEEIKSEKKNVQKKDSD